MYTQWSTHDTQSTTGYKWSAIETEDMLHVGASRIMEQPPKHTEMKLAYCKCETWFNTLLFVEHIA